MRDGYRVEVYRWGEQILSIEPNMLAGDPDLSDDDLRGIKSAGEHLVGFAGDPDKPDPCFICGCVNGCDTDCPNI